LEDEGSAEARSAGDDGDDNETRPGLGERGSRDAAGRGVSRRDGERRKGRGRVRGSRGKHNLLGPIKVTFAWSSFSSTEAKAGPPLLLDWLGFAFARALITCLPPAAGLGRGRVMSARRPLVRFLCETRPGNGPSPFLRSVVPHAIPSLTWSLARLLHALTCSSFGEIARSLSSLAPFEGERGVSRFQGAV
jgi:hypothetical protein